MKNDVTVHYGLSVAVYSLGYVAMSAFSSLYLLDKGFTNGQIGILLAIASLVSVALQPVAGALIDRNPKVSTKGVLLSIASVILVMGIVLLVFPNMGFESTSIIYGLSIMLLMLGQPFINALGTDAINYGYKINLGAGRSLGSLGYAIGSFAFGRISVIFGPKSVPSVFSIAFFVFSLILVFYPVKKDIALQVSDDNKPKESPFLFLIKYKRFTVTLFGLILVYFSHSLINTFALQVVTTKGGTSGDMGTASAIAAGCELITAFFFFWYMKHIKLSTIIKVSGVFFTLKIFFSFLVPNVITFYLIQALQMFGWGFMAIGVVVYVNALVGNDDKAQGQAYAGMAYTIACVIATSLGGVILDKFGVNMMLITGTILSALGTIILWFSVEDVKA